MPKWSTSADGQFIAEVANLSTCNSWQSCGNYLILAPACYNFIMPDLPSNSDQITPWQWKSTEETVDAIPVQRREVSRITERVEAAEQQEFALGQKALTAQFMNAVDIAQRSEARGDEQLEGMYPLLNTAQRLLLAQAAWEDTLCSSSSLAADRGIAGPSKWCWLCK
jgi:hypothetical protein